MFVGYSAVTDQPYKGPRPSPGFSLRESFCRIFLQPRCFPEYYPSSLFNPGSVIVVELFCFESRHKIMRDLSDVEHQTKD